VHFFVSWRKDASREGRGPRPAAPSAWEAAANGTSSTDVVVVVVVMRGASAEKRQCFGGEERRNSWKRDQTEVLWRSFLPFFPTATELPLNV